jgi:hypothetical protein
VSHDTDYEQSGHSVPWLFFRFLSTSGFVAFVVVSARRYGLEIGLIPLDLGEDSHSESSKFATLEYK